MKKMRTLVGVLAVIVGLASLATAAEGDAPTKDEIAKELANPNTALASMKLQTQYFIFDGNLPRADDQDMLKLFFQPTLPFPLRNGKTVWVRPGVPYVFDQPVFDAGTRRLGSKSGFGDMTLDVQYGATLENGVLWSVGFSSLFPTAADGLGGEQWTLGPGFQLGLITETSIWAVFINHQWDIAGDGKSNPDLPFLRRVSSDAEVNLTAIQPFGVILPGGGWNYGSQPIITYNHESGDWTVPLHVSAGKTFIINGRPWDVSLDLNYYVENPDAIAPEWMIGFNISPVVQNRMAEWFN